MSPEAVFFLTIGEKWKPLYYSDYNLMFSLLTLIVYAH